MSIIRCVLPLSSPHAWYVRFSFLSRVPADLQSCVNVQAHPHNGPPPSPSPLPPSRHCSFIFFFSRFREKKCENVPFHSVLVRSSAFATPSLVCPSAFDTISSLEQCAVTFLSFCPSAFLTSPFRETLPEAERMTTTTESKTAQKKKKQNSAKSKKKKKKRRGGPQSAAWQRATLFLKTVGWLCPPHIS